MSDELCLRIDPTGYTWMLPCGQPTPDPCLPEGTTLLHIMPCTDENLPLDEWCQTYTDHPACVGLPPTGSTTVIAITGLGFLVAGLVCLLPRHHSRRSSAR